MHTLGPVNRLTLGTDAQQNGRLDGYKEGIILLWGYRSSSTFRTAFMALYKTDPTITKSILFVFAVYAWSMTGNTAKSARPRA
jgi:AraC-like DNA-binding protein